MIGVPAAADIGFLFLLFPNAGDLAIAVDMREEFVDVDGAEFLRKGDVLIFGEVLIAEEDHAVIGISLLDRGQFAIAQTGEIDAQNFRAAMGQRHHGEAFDLRMRVHGVLRCSSSYATRLRPAAGQNYHDRYSYTHGRLSD